MAVRGLAPANSLPGHHGGQACGARSAAGVGRTVLRGGAATGFRSRAVRRATCRVRSVLGRSTVHDAGLGGEGPDRNLVPGLAGNAAPLAVMGSGYYPRVGLKAASSLQWPAVGQGGYWQSWRAPLYRAGGPQARVRRGGGGLCG
jgi:hypothetical protein